MSTVSRIQALAIVLSSPTVLDGTHLKEVTSFNYENHKCGRIFKGSKYIYAHGKNDTVDILNPKDLNLISTLDIDGNKLNFALEMNDKYIFIGSDRCYVFCFDLKKHERI